MKKENVVKNAVNKTGFTLIELLVVVLIIGILSAIALPGYRRSVERSRVSDALTTMQAVAKSEHGWYLTNNSYTNDFANLDIDINGTINEGALETDLYTYELLDTGILAGRNNGEYTIYKDYETSQIMCTPGSHYICENLGAFTKEPCEKVGMAWANTNSTCYVNEEERCKGLYDDGMWYEDTANPNNSFCGYRSIVNVNHYNGANINEGMKCIGICQKTIVNDGGMCVADGHGYACSGSTINAGGICTATSSYKGYASVCSGVTIRGGECNAGCLNAIVYEGGVCSGFCQGATINSGGICSGDCVWASIKDGGICKSSATNRCGSSNSYTAYYSGTGCCEGDYCGDKPKCECPIDENTGMHKTSC